MSRFIDRKYYPEIDSKTAWMLSFMESEKKEYIQSSDKIVSSLNELLEDLFSTSIIHKIGDRTINIEIDYDLDVYDSMIRRNDDTELTMYHIFLDYYDWL